MKIAVYSITKNEQDFVDRMIESALDADEIVIVDTGSTDRTVQRVKKWVQALPDKVKLFEISVRPWRFDVPRNASLALVSSDADVCICLDLDEVLQPGWREGLEASWTPETTRLRYSYIWNWTAEGKPDISYHADKIHSRHGYRWVHAVHEVLKPYLMDELQTWTSDVAIHHHPDDTKSRAQYLPLLSMAVAEDPLDDRNLFYYGRELFFRQAWRPALDQLAQHRATPRAVWAPERAKSWRISAECHAALGEHAEADAAIEAALVEDPSAREGYYDGARLAAERGDWSRAFDLLQRGLPLAKPDGLYITENAAYGEPYDRLMAWAEAEARKAIEK